MIMMKKILTAHKIAKIKGAKISLWTNSPKLRAAKIKGFTVVSDTWTSLQSWNIQFPVWLAVCVSKFKIAVCVCCTSVLVMCIIYFRQVQNGLSKPPTSLEVLVGTAATVTYCFTVISYNESVVIIVDCGIYVSCCDIIICRHNCELWNLCLLLWYYYMSS